MVEGDLERSQAEQKSLNQLKTEEGKVTTDLKGIVQEQERFYKNLYRSDTKNNTRSIKIPASRKNLRMEQKAPNYPK